MRKLFDKNEFNNNLNYFESQLSHDSIVSEGKVYNIPKHQHSTHSNNEFVIHKVSPINAYDSSKASAMHNIFLDFEIPNVKGYLFQNITLHLKVFNDTNATIYHTCIPNFIKTYELIQNGTQIKNSFFDEKLLLLKNMLPYDRNTYNGDWRLQIAGINNFGYNDNQPLTGSCPANENYTHRINLKTFMSNTDFYRPNVEGSLILRIYFADKFGVNNTSDENFSIKDVQLFIESIKISEKLEKKLFKQDLSYRVQNYYHRSYNLVNGISSNEQEVILTSINDHISCMFFFIEKLNDTLDNKNKFYRIKSLRLVDQNNQSLINSIDFTGYYLCHLFQKFFPNSSAVTFFENPKMIFLPFSSDPANDILFNHHSGCKFVPANSKLIFTNWDTDANNVYKLHILYFCPSFVNIVNGKLSLE